ncbi:MAG: addiction module protein [Candidatus Rokubacteria bacterium]|nr:addiction module protein [Candidatus Rokubacteria bacterium]
MSPKAEKVLLEALRLPQKARAEIAGSLIQSLDERVDEDAEAAWANEIERRIRDVESGAVKLVPWSQVRRALHRKSRGGSKPR